MRKTEISVASGRPQCSYNYAIQNQENYTSFSQNQESYDPTMFEKIPQRKTGGKSEKKREHWSTKQTSVLVKCWKEHSSKLESARASKFWNIIRDEVTKHGPEKTLQTCKDKINNLRIVIKKLKKTTSKKELYQHFLPFMRTSTKFLNERYHQHPWLC